MAKNKNNAPAKPALAPADALYQAVSLCRKAGALTMGFDAVEDACVKGIFYISFIHFVHPSDDILPRLYNLILIL